MAHRVGFELSWSDTPDEVLVQHGRRLHAELYLTDARGRPLTKRVVQVPEELLRRMNPPPGRRKKGPEGEFGPPPRPEAEGELGPPAGRKKGPPGRRPPPVELVTNADGYWSGIRMPVSPDLMPSREMAFFIIHSRSLFNEQLFFDWRPVALVAAVALTVSVLCWLPFLRGLTRAIGQLTQATQEIAAGRFETPLPAPRSDEVGALGRQIHELAERLSGFVRGQKRFLGDIAHELSAPIARVQFALGILEQNSTEQQQRHVTVLHEELQEMSSLVSELLSFSKAGLHPADTPLATVNVAAVVNRVVAREMQRAVEVNVESGLCVLANEGLLQRSLANLLRNAVRYAGESPISIRAVPDGLHVAITVGDHGPGVPEDALGQIFEPFYRPEESRTRATGGVGLGLAIVKSCVEACRGTVQCRNRQPHGLEVTIRLAQA